MRIAGIELGGTKSIILLWKDGEVTQRNTFPTTSPAETLGRLHRQLAHWNGETVLDALGIASFGPFALDRASPSFGTMLPTPKQGWSGAPVTEALTEGLTCPWARSEEHTSELQSLMRISYAVFCLKKKN